MRSIRIPVSFLISLMILFRFNTCYSQTASLTLISQTQGDQVAQQQIKLVQPNGQVIYNQANNLQGHLYLDPTVQLPATYLPNQTTNSTIRMLDKSLNPGTINANYTVNSSGAFNYQIPIQLPPGTNNMVPSVGLSYSSNGGDNEVGMGWGISGLSVITRTAKNNYYDGIRSGIEFNANGPFALDGIRLASQGVNASGQNYFFTENEIFSQITFVAPYFEVKTKNGLTMIYGSTADSRLSLVAGVVGWYLSKTTDNYGNYVEYTYSNTGNEIVISEIKYTGNAAAGISPYNKVKFFYDKKSFSQKQYLLDELIEKKLLLREIAVYGADSPVMLPIFKYDFKYSFGDFNYLNEIIFSNKNAEQLNSTVFVYGANQPANKVTDNPPTQIAVNNDCSSADFNGDGLSDLIVFQYNPSLTSSVDGTKFYTDWYLLLNNGNGFPTWPNQTITEVPFFLPFSNANNVSLGISPVKNGFLFDDVYGDETPEVIYSKDVNGNFSTMKAYSFDKTISQMQSLTLNTAYPNGFSLRTASGSNQSVNLMLGDFDGNGKGELITFWKDVSNGDFEFKHMDFVANSVVSRSNNGTALSVTDINNITQNISQYSNLTAYDFNGDGKSELVGRRGSNIFVVIKVTVSGSSITLQEIANPASGLLNHSHFGDYNGDGLPDYIRQNATDVTLFLGTGTDFVNGGTLVGHELSVNRKLIPMDINGDGKTDLVELYNNNNNLEIGACLGGQIMNNFILLKTLNNTKVPLNKNDEIPAGGNDRTYDNVVDGSDDYETNPYSTPMYEVGDYNGDGYQDLLLKLEINAISYVKIINFNYFSDFRYITNIYDGNNNEVQVNYASLPKLSVNSPQYFKSSVVPPLPLSNRTLPITVAYKMLDKTDGVNMIDEYYYYNLLLHTNGRGILGFDKIVKKHIHPVSLDNYQVTNEFGLDNVHFVRVPTKSKSEFLSSSGNKIYNTTTYNTSVYSYATTPNARRYFIKANSISTVDNYLNSTTNITFSYDNFTGNLLSKKTNVGPGAEIALLSYSNFISAGAWINNSPQNLSATLTRAGESPFVKNTTYSYDVNKGALLSVTVDANTFKSVVTTNGYNASTGVLTSVTTAAPNDPTSPPVKVISYDYDDKFRFIERTYLPLGYVKECKYDPVYGKIISSKDVGGLITYLRYNNFGRLVENVSPDGSKSSFEYKWFTPSDIDIQDPMPVNVNDAQFVNTVVRSDGKTEKTTIDKFDRVLKIETKIFNSKKSNLITYNDKGEVYKERGPYLIPVPLGKAILETTNTYRTDLGELVTKQVSDGVTNVNTAIVHTFNTTTKQSLVKTIHPDNKTSWRITDQTGKLVESWDNLGNILQYEYHFNGTNFINKTKLNGNDVLIQKSDVYNHLVEETEPNSGTKTYVYNAYGQIKLMTDNKNIAYSYQYDQLDRQTQKVVGNDTYNYVYINSGTGKGQIYEASVNGGNVTRYEYDNLTRLIHIREFADGIYHNTRYDYNELSQLVKHTYPNNFSVTKEYAQGDLVKIKSGNAILWQLNEIDNCGAINKFTYGNGIQTVRSYDNFGYATNFYAANVQNLSLSYNKQNGNLTSLTDYSSGITEQFTFDNLNRLTTMDDSYSQVTSNIGYDNNGNIINKYDAGNYNYNGVKVNATIKASNPNSSINLIQQDIDFTSFSKMKYVEEGPYAANIYYGPEQQRYKTTFFTNGALIKTRYYFSGYEKNIETANGKVTEINYIEAPTGLCAMNVTENGVSMLYYTHIDHVGSIVALTSQGGVYTRQSFDAWGVRRDWTTHGYNTLNTIPDWLYRGFTGHEHLYQFDLINMNGRMYDPKLGRMLSVDPVLLDNTDSQAFNKYSYANNNPLTYVDPSGNFALWDDILVSGVGFAIGYVGYGLNTGDWGAKAFISGGISAAMFEVGYLTCGLGVVGFMDMSIINYAISTALPISSIPIYKSDDLNISVTPIVGIGSSGFTAGAAINLNGSANKFKYQASFGFGFNSGIGDLSGAASSSSYWNIGAGAGYEANHTYYGLYFSHNQFFGGNTSQGVPAITAQIGDFSIRLDEDVFYGEDKYRTGGALATYRLNDEITFAFGGSMITGEGNKKHKVEPPTLNKKGNVHNTYSSKFETNPYRGGIVMGGIMYKNKMYLLGTNSENTLHNIQNPIHNITDTYYFEDLHYASRSYSYMGNYNRNYLFY